MHFVEFVELVFQRFYHGMNTTEKEQQNKSGSVKTG